jgi:hypothetical protein
MVNTCIFSVVIVKTGRRSVRCVHKSDVCPPGGFNKIENERIEKNEENLRSITVKF